MAEGHTVGVSRSERADPTEKKDVKSNQTWQDLFQNTKIGDIVVHSKNAPSLVSTTDDESVAVAFKKLIDHQLLSLPVYDKSRGRFTEFVDVIDILVHVLQSFPRDKLDPNMDFTPYMKEPVSSLTDLSSRNPYVAVEMNAPLVVALRKMVSKGLHRIPVVDGAGHLDSILTQSSIINFIANNINLFDMAQKTVGELGLGYKARIVAARRTQTAGSAFVSMLEHKVSGLAVVDEENKLVGNISSTDIKSIGFSGQLFLKLFLTVGEFIGNRTAIYVTPKHTIAEVLKLFSEKRIHRLYVCQGDREILGVISLVDLLKVFMHD